MRTAHFSANCLIWHENTSGRKTGAIFAATDGEPVREKSMSCRNLIFSALLASGVLGTTAEAAPIVSGISRSTYTRATAAGTSTALGSKRTQPIR